MQTRLRWIALVCFDEERADRGREREKLRWEGVVLDERVPRLDVDVYRVAAVAGGGDIKRHWTVSRVTTSKTALQYSCSTAEQMGFGDVDVVQGAYRVLSFLKVWDIFIRINIQPML